MSILAIHQQRPAIGGCNAVWVVWNSLSTTFVTGGGNRNWSTGQWSYQVVQSSPASGLAHCSGQHQRRNGRSSRVNRSVIAARPVNCNAVVRHITSGVNRPFVFEQSQRSTPPVNQLNNNGPVNVNNWTSLTWRSSITVNVFNRHTANTS